MDVPSTESEIGAGAASADSGSLAGRRRMDSLLWAGLCDAAGAAAGGEGVAAGKAPSLLTAAEGCGTGSEGAHAASRSAAAAPAAARRRKE
ncbi:hypothetical protein D9M72_437840 [compost metagenome]